MEQKKVSIIVPVYNTAPNLLNTCICSILQQTYSNIEIVIVDDGSECIETVNQYNSLAMKDTRIKLVVQNNMGTSEARYKGIQYAKGDFIIFCDSDDSMHPAACSFLLELMQEGKFDLAEAVAIEVDDLENINFSEYGDSDAKVTIHSNQLLMEKLITSCTVPLGWSLWGKMFKADLLKTYCKAHDGIHRGQDLLTLAEYVQQIQHYVWSNRVVYFYNQGNPNSVTKSKDVKKNITICRYGKRMVEIYKNSGCKKGYLYAKANYCGMLFGSLLQCMNNNIENHLTIEKKIRKEMWKYSPELLCNPFINSRIKNIIALLCPRIFILIKKLRNMKYWRRIGD